MGNLNAHDRFDPTVTRAYKNEKRKEQSTDILCDSSMCRKRVYESTKASPSSLVQNYSVKVQTNASGPEARAKVIKKIASVCV